MGGTPAPTNVDVSSQAMTHLHIFVVIIERRL